MIALVILAAWLVGLAVAFVLWCALWTAKHADDAMYQDAGVDPFDGVDAVAWDFPANRTGHWSA